jgi:hypothetical protein
MSLEHLFSSSEVIEVVATFIDPLSAIELTRTSSTMYTSLPRNSSLGVQTWKMYLTKPHYLTNRLVIETAKSLVESELVSRSNYKCILAVLVQKNGFMKISRLKSLCVSGKLASPVLPHKGGWRMLVRFDQFALKRASKDPVENRSDYHISDMDVPIEVKFIARIAGQKGKTDMLKQKLSALPKHEFTDLLTSVLNIVVREHNFPGLLDIIEAIRENEAVSAIDESIRRSITPFKTALDENLLHLIIKDSSIKVNQKVSLLRCLLQYDSTKKLINALNLNHETALVLLSKTVTSSLSPERELWQQAAEVLIMNGADVYLCDRKGYFYEPLISKGA